MVDDVALPLAARYPRQAWELLPGYDQQRLISERADRAIVCAARDADQAATLRLAVA